MKLLINKTVLAIICFASIFFLCSSLTADDDVRQNGNIEKIDARITLNGDALWVHSKLSLRTDGSDPYVGRFYLLSEHLLDSLKITNESGVELDYEFVTLKGASFLEVKVADDHNIHVDYSVNLPKMKSTISHYRDDNQYFILGETSVLPLNNVMFLPDKIDYTLKVAETAGKYNYVKTPSPGYYRSMPPLFFGNFNITQYDGVKVYTPVNVNVNKKSMDDIVSLIADSYDYYTNVFGKSLLTDDIEVFFLNRRGGYGLPGGIVLSQEYISKTNDVSTDQDVIHVVSHEIAHLWWAISVLTKNGGITEGLAELSSDLYRIDNKKQLSWNIYSEKNIIVQEAGVKPVDITTLSEYGKKYKATAYNKLPIIFHEAEVKIGRERLLESLSSFYNAEAGSLKFCDFDDIISHFPEDHQAELTKDLNGTIVSWPDYYVKNVSGKKVVFKGDNVYFKEIVPVELTTKQNKTILDTLYFDVDKAELTKHYDKDIVKVVIDPAFATNQSELMNDSWPKDATSLWDNKWQQYPYEQKYFNFADTLLRALFTNDRIATEDIVVDKGETLLIFGKLKESVKKQNINIEEAFLTIRAEDQYFKISVMKYNGEYKSGFIEGDYYESPDGRLYLKTFRTIRF